MMGKRRQKRIGSSVRQRRIVVMSGPNHQSVSMTPSRTSNPSERGRLAGGRTKSAHPSGDRPTRPGQICTKPGSGRAERNGGGPGLSLERPIWPQCSANSGRTAERNGIHASLSATYHEMLVPSHFRAKSIGGKTCHPSSLATQNGSQNWNPRKGLMPNKPRSPRTGSGPSR